MTIVHKGQHHEITEGGFRDWAYDLARREFSAVEIDGGPWCKLPGGTIIKDSIAAFLQQILLRPAEYSVIATLNLNGDYISDAPRAGGRDWDCSGANINYMTGHAIFEATHGTAQVRRSGQGKPRISHPLGCHDAGIPWLAGSRRPDLQWLGKVHCRKAGHL